MASGSIWRFSGAGVVVAGAGVTGRATATVLAELGARVTVTDGDAARLASLRELGGFDMATVANLTVPPDGTDLVVTSPGWRPDAPLLAAAAERGVEIIGDVELAWRMGAVPSALSGGGPAPVWLAVTGTNGKTTTVGMLESILLAAGELARACGNIGLPVPSAVAQGYRTLAVELSSFQLHWASNLRPLASAVLNVSEDHLDWHGGIEPYAAAKGSIYRGARYAVFNIDDPWSTSLAASHPRRIGVTTGEPGPRELGIRGGMLVDRAFSDGTELVAVSEVSPPGPHNLGNALAAAALALCHGVPAAAVREGLRSYLPGAHRAVPVGEIAGVRYVDDSKATNPHAAAASLLAHRDVVWIAGGQLKGASVDGLVREVADRLSGAVLLGADQQEIAEALARHAADVPVLRVGSGEDDPMAIAVEQARTLVPRGGVVLLAPAAASLDMFDDYAQRGRAFVSAVEALAGGDARGGDVP